MVGNVVAAVHSHKPEVVDSIHPHRHLALVAGNAAHRGRKDHRVVGGRRGPGNHTSPAAARRDRSRSPAQSWALHRDPAGRDGPRAGGICRDPRSEDPTWGWHPSVGRCGFLGLAGSRVWASWVWKPLPRDLYVIKQCVNGNC